MHGLHIVQYDSFYRIFTPTGVEIGQVFLPPDRQYLKHAMALKGICLYLAKIWQIQDSTKR